MALGPGYVTRMSGCGGLGPDIQAWISNLDIRAQICGPENRGPDFGPGCPGLNILPGHLGPDIQVGHLGPYTCAWISGPCYQDLDIQGGGLKKAV